MSLLHRPLRLFHAALASALVCLALVFAATVPLARHQLLPGAAPCPSVPALTQASTRGLPPQLERVARQLQEDMVVHTFAAPQLQVWVSDEPHAQARAHLDQGAIEVTQGLLDAWLSDDELYAALAHEGAHLALHTAQCPTTDRERHAQELEADQQAVELLRMVGRDPQALARALRKLEDAPTLDATATHPALATRLQALSE